MNLLPIVALYWVRALLLHVAGCDVFEDWSAICHGIRFGVPW